MHSRRPIALLLALSLPQTALAQITPPAVRLATVSPAAGSPATGSPAAANSAAHPAAPSPAAATLTQAATLARGRALATQFLAQNLSPVWNTFLPQVQGQFGTLGEFVAYRRQGVQDYGRELKVLREEAVSDPDTGLNYYVRTATFERGPRVAWSLVFGFDAQGRVASFGILGGELPSNDQIS